MYQFCNVSKFIKISNINYQLLLSILIAIFTRTSTFSHTATLGHFIFFHKIFRDHPALEATLKSWWSVCPFHGRFLRYATLEEPVGVFEIHHFAANITGKPRTTDFRAFDSSRILLLADFYDFPPIFQS